MGPKGHVRGLTSSHLAKSRVRRGSDVLYDVRRVTIARLICPDPNPKTRVASPNIEVSHRPVITTPVSGYVTTGRVRPVGQASLDPGHDNTGKNKRALAHLLTLRPLHLRAVY